MSTLLYPFLGIFPLFSAKIHIALTKPTQIAGGFPTYYIICKKHRKCATYSPVGFWRPIGVAVPKKANGYNQTKNLYVILSGVEISPSEERGEIKERSDAGISEQIWVACQGDVTSCKKPPRLVTRSRKPRCVLRFCLACRSAEVRLRSG